MGAIIGMKGISPQPNHFTVPRGACLVASNCVIPSKDVMEPRRGQPKLSYAFGSSTHRARAMHMFQNKLLVWRDTGNVLAYDTGAAFTDLSGTYSPPDATTLAMKFADMAKSMYFTTSAAPYALSAFNGTPRAAGLPKPWDFYTDPGATNAVRLDGNPNAGWMTVNTSVGYRAVIGLRDANGVIRLSAPCGRAVLSNPADLSVAIGSLTRAAGVVSATVTSHGYRTGDIITMTSAGEVNFPNGTKTITSTTSTIFTYTEAGANAASTAIQTFSSGTKNTQVTVFLPSGLTAGSHFVQLYRTRMSASAGADPKDEMFQVYERFVAAADIASGQLIIPDTCIEGVFQGAPLYTNAISGLGSFQANNQPPIASDMAVWDNRIWLAQTTDRQRLTFRILGIGAPSGLQAGDILCLGDRAYKAQTDFALSTDYTPATNISLTIGRLIHIANLVITSGITLPHCSLYSLEDGTVYPPSILYEEIGIGGAATYAACSRASAIAERLPAATSVTTAFTARTGGNTVTVRAVAHGFAQGQSIVLAVRTADANFPPGLKTVASVIDADNFTYTEAGANATMGGEFYVYATTYPSSNNKLPLRYSKQLEPESFPLTNYPTGLPDNADVLRIMPLRDKLYVFLKNSDIYTVSGSWPYQVQRFDATAQLVAPDTLIEHAGRLIGLTTQGVVAISDGGVEVLSYDIEPELDPLIATMIANSWQQYAFAVSYESERQYQLWVPTASGGASKAYVYNSLTRDWTTWTQKTTCGLVNPVSKKLTLGCSDENTLRVENKDFARSDYADQRSDLESTGAGSGLTVTVVVDSGVISHMAGGAGDYIDAFAYMSPAGLSKRWILVTSVNNGTNTLTLENTADGTALAAYLRANVPSFFSVYRAISTTVSPVPDFAMAPDLEKQWREEKLHFAFFDVAAPTINNTSEKQSSPVASVPSAGTWPQYSGTAPETSLSPVVLRVDVPEECERAVLLYPAFVVSEPLALWRLCGFTTTGDPISERTGT